MPEGLRFSILGPDEVLKFRIKALTSLKNNGFSTENALDILEFLSSIGPGPF
jgi:hypothetical protein